MKRGGGPIRQEHVRECNVEDQMSQSRTPSRLPSEPGPLCTCLIKHLISFSLVFKADMIDNLCTGPKKNIVMSHSFVFDRCDVAKRAPE